MVRRRKSESEVEGEGGAGNGSGNRRRSGAGSHAPPPAVRKQSDAGNRGDAGEMSGGALMCTGSGEDAYPDDGAEDQGNRSGSRTPGASRRTSSSRQCSAQRNRAPKHQRNRGERHTVQMEQGLSQERGQTTRNASRSRREFGRGSRARETDEEPQSDHSSSDSEFNRNTLRLSPSFRKRKRPDRYTAKSCKKLRRSSENEVLELRYEIPWKEVVSHLKNAVVDEYVKRKMKKRELEKLSLAGRQKFEENRVMASFGFRCALSGCTQRGALSIVDVEAMVPKSGAEEGGEEVFESFHFPVSLRVDLANLFRNNVFTFDAMQDGVVWKLKTRFAPNWLSTCNESSPYWMYDQVEFEVDARSIEEFEPPL